MDNYKLEFDFETKKLDETKNWILQQIDHIDEDEKKLKDKIFTLKKASRGSYNEELETSQRLYEIVHKNLNSYNEAYEEPYFARIDFREYRKEKESYYIGKFGLGDISNGEEIVIDWRAPIADLYYSGTEGDCYYVAPIGTISGELNLKRKFLFEDRNLKEIFDENTDNIILRSAGEVEGNALVDEFLRINLEKNTGKKLKDVVATIQKEQNAIIRAEKNLPIIVQGSAGSGKTTVALHRLAYLLYRYKEKLKGEDILVLAPNRLFLDYISEVLPNLGVDKVKQKTFDDMAMELLNLKGKIYTKDKMLSEILECEDKEKIKYMTNSSKVKGSSIFKTMLDRYIKLIEKQDGDIEDIKVEQYVLFEVKEIKRLYLKDMVNLPINKRKQEIKRYLKLKLNDKILEVMEKVDFYYEYTIARLKKTMEDGIDRRKKLIEIYDERDNKKKSLKESALKSFDDYFNNWGNLKTENLYKNFFEDEEIFAQSTGGKIPEALAGYMKDTLKENMEKKIVDSDDLAPMLYLKFKIEGVEEKQKFSHVVIDEAQDYSLMAVEALKFITYSNSFTIVGDLGQGIYYYKGIDDWDKLSEEVFQGEFNYVPLTQSYRSTIEIINFANKILQKQQNNLKPAVPVLRHGKEPEVVCFTNNRDFAARADNIVKEVYDLNRKSIAIVGRTHKECKKIYEHMKKYSSYDWKLIKEGDETIELNRIIIPSYMTKGLEFDCSIIYNCNQDNYKDTELDKKLLYVVLTRALHLEYVFYQGEISELLDN